MAGFGFSCGKSAVEWNVLLYLYWLGVEFTPQFLSRETLHTIYFPNCRRTLRSYFFARKLIKFINEKSCVIMENWNQTLWKTFKDNSQPKKFRKTETKLCGNLQRQFSDFSNLKTIFSPKLCGKLKTETKLCEKPSKIILGF